MKIAYLHQYFNTPEMLGGTRSFEVARRLVAAGHEVEMITSWRDATDKKDWFTTNECGIVVHWLPVPYSNRMGFLSRLWAFFRFASKSRRRVAKTKADLVFATSTPLTIALPAVRSAKKLGVPMVFEVRDLWPEMPIATGDLKNPLLIWVARELERFAYRNAKHIVALSPGMRDGIVETGYPVSDISVIPNSSDIGLFNCPDRAASDVLEDFPKLNGRKLVVYCGTFGRVNKVGYLAELAAEVRRLDDSIIFAAIGDGAEYDLVKQEAESLGVLRENFFIFPGVAKNNVPPILNSADMSLSLFANLPAMQRNSANKFFDTLAAGKPIGINYGGWHADLIEEFEVGIVLDPSPSRSAERLVKMLNDSKSLYAMGERSRVLAETKFDRDLLVKQLEALLVEAVA